MFNSSKYVKSVLLGTCLTSFFTYAQKVEADKNAPQYVKQIVQKANNESQLESLAFELLDVIGPRLVG